MVFTSVDYFAFFAIVFCAYWAVRRRTVQNLLLLVGSYVFYAWVHPWFCLLIATSTVVDYACGRGMGRWPGRRHIFLIVSLCCNLGLLGVFKYFNFFYDSFHAVAEALGLNFHPRAFRILLPAGISFYTFQTLSYTIDVYWGKLEPRRSFLDFAVFVALFPQLVSGPIERASRLLPQVERARQWTVDNLAQAWPLLLGGYLKKIVIADNVAVFVDKVYMLQHPPLSLLAVGTAAFAVQIYADFSAYTDIARGSARLLGFDLMRNFDSPYLAISPSDFWRRWHISFSTWIRDYLYIPLGGSRVGGAWRFAPVILVTMGLAGLWHGAEWHYVAWGLYHGLALFVYHRFGCAGRWRPEGRLRTFVAWAGMMAITMIGWLLFRAPSLRWLWGALASPVSGLAGESLTVAVAAGALVLFYSSPLVLMAVLRRRAGKSAIAQALVQCAALVAIVLLGSFGGNDFIYFQF